MSEQKERDLGHTYDSGDDEENFISDSDVTEQSKVAQIENDLNRHADKTGYTGNEDEDWENYRKRFK